MNRIYVFLTIVSVTLSLSACNKTLRIDGTSKETTKISFDEMRKGLTDGEKKELVKDIVIIMFVETNSYNRQESFYELLGKRLDGKSKEEIHELAVAIKKKVETRPVGVRDKKQERKIASSETYLGCDSEHWLQEIIKSGELVELEDGSIWEISPYSNVDAILWLVTEDIVVKTSQDPNYPYKLINTDEGTSAEARLIRQ